MPRRGRRIRLATGIFRDKTGIAVILPTVNAAGKPDQIEHRYPPDADVEKLKEWRADELRKHQARKKDGRLPPGTFAADAQRYLEAVRALPTWDQRCDEIAVWVEAFGERRRRTIEPWEIRALRDQWLTVGPKKIQKAPRAGLPAVWTTIAAPLAPSTVNKRLRALENLWSVLDGKKHDNPVREVPECDEGTPPPRGQPYEVIERIFAAMPRQHAMTVRLRIMAYAGLAQSELARVDPEQGHLDIDGRAVWVPGRKKGRGAKGGWVPLSPKALKAFKELVRLEACGPFNTSSLWHFFQRYARALGYAHLRPYDLRHSLFTGLYATSGDERAVQAVSRHASVVTLRRYTEAAVQPRARAAVQAFSRRRPVPDRVPAFASGVPRNRMDSRGLARKKTQ